MDKKLEEKITEIEEKLEERISKIYTEYNKKINAAPTEEVKTQLAEERSLLERRLRFGAEVKKRRLRSGMTRKELANKIRKSESYLKRIENEGILSQRPQEIVDNLVAVLRPWSRKNAYNILKLENTKKSEKMTVNDAKEKLADALTKTENVHQFILQALDVRTKFFIDNREKHPGEFLHSQKVAEIIFNIKEMNPREIAQACLMIGINEQLTVKQWIRILKNSIEKTGKEVLVPLQDALADIMDDPKEAPEMTAKKFAQLLNKEKINIETLEKILRSVTKDGGVNTLIQLQNTLTEIFDDKNVQGITKVETKHRKAKSPGKSKAPEIKYEAPNTDHKQSHLRKTFGSVYEFNRQLFNQEQQIAFEDFLKTLYT